MVEGHGETEAVPVLLRRIAARLEPAKTLSVSPPLRIPKSRLIRRGELERAVDLAARKIAGQGAVFILLDSDDDCPAELGPLLAARVSEVRNDLPSAVVLAKREFEAWFLAAAESLRGLRGLDANLQAPQDPELVRGAMEWLDERMAGGYSETLDQPALAAQFDLDIARQSPSFDKCYREIVRLLTAAPEAGA